MTVVFMVWAIYLRWVFVTCETSVRHVTNDRFTRDEHFCIIYVISNRCTWHTGQECIVTTFMYMCDGVSFRFVAVSLYGKNLPVEGKKVTRRMVLLFFIANFARGILRSGD